ncbi:MAG: cellulase family glycosylhydrolase [Pirellulales bacterium]|nr:cellulase family glycosylhydrolase [Pirellulales bacterium]
MKVLFDVSRLISVLLLCGSYAFAADGSGERWSVEKVKSWYEKQPWLIGCNYVPAYAVNQMEMWQADSFDPKAIDRELALAEDIGFNIVRVFLHDVAWEADPDGFKNRIDAFLDICNKHKIRVMLTFFTNGGPGMLAKVGKQPEPIPGVHNSQWPMSPGTDNVNDPSSWGRLEKYVKDILTRFGNDNRVVIWDLYNEPEKTKNGANGLPLLRQVFVWGREVNPSQPLTACMDGYRLDAFNSFLAENCDVLTFHTYGGPKSVKAFIKTLKDFKRPMLCTEYMARNFGSTFEALLPIFKRERVGAISWGLVWGKTNTVYPWGSKKGSPEPKVWFHDIFRPDHTPYDRKEIEFIKKIARDNR